jgi:hypothetical protein
MTAKNFHIIKSKNEDTCFYCNAPIGKGENVLALMFPFVIDYSGIKVDFIKIHLSCINSFCKELMLEVKNKILQELE